MIQFGGDGPHARAITVWLEQAQIFTATAYRAADGAASRPVEAMMATIRSDVPQARIDAGTPPESGIS